MSMPRSSRNQWSRLTPEDPTTVKEKGDTIVVESPTAEEALDRLATLLGPNVDILAAQKVARGGVGGFFAREMIQLTVRRPDQEVPGAVVAKPAPSDGIPAHLSALLSERTRSEEFFDVSREAEGTGEKPAAGAGPGAGTEEEETFAQALRRQMAMSAAPNATQRRGPARPSPAEASAMAAEAAALAADRAADRAMVEMAREAAEEDGVIEATALLTGTGPELRSVSTFPAGSVPLARQVVNGRGPLQLPSLPAAAVASVRPLTSGVVDTALLATQAALADHPSQHRRAGAEPWELNASRRARSGAGTPAAEVPAIPPAVSRSPHAPRNRSREIEVNGDPALQGIIWVDDDEDAPPPEPPAPTATTAEVPSRRVSPPAGSAPTPASVRMQPVLPQSPVRLQPVSAPATERVQPVTLLKDQAPGRAPSGGVITLVREAPAPQAPATPDPEPVTSLRIRMSEGSGTGAVAWSPDELVRLGLPFSFIRPLLDLDPEDDMAWIQSIAASAHSLCRPLPAGDAAIAGARAGYLAQALGVPSLRRPERAPDAGSICCSMLDDAESRKWLRRVSKNRWIHVVAGGFDVRAFLDLEPMAISWVGGDILPSVLRLASEAAVPLGWFRAEHGPVRRATPLEIALAVRELVVRR
jgi:hypothetical protein